MASPSWGLYEDLPPPTSGASAPTTIPIAASTNTTKQDISEWTSNPKLAKMMPTAIRKKGLPMVPRSTHVAPKPKTTRPPENKVLAVRPLEANLKSQDSALALVSAAYPLDTPHPMEVEEEYDPARPNEYEKYVADRMHKQKAEKEEETPQDREQWETEDTPPKPAVDLTVSGEEAYNRRAKLSGRAPSPPRNTPSESDDIDGEALDPPPTVVSRPKESVAARMMARMGWREGSGLGKEEQGMTTALVHKKTDRNTGVIVNAPPVATPKPTRTSSHFPAQLEQSRVLLLKNMVGPGEVDDDLESEIASECSKYGEVIKCMIYEVVGGLAGPSEAVRIFLQFTRPESALKGYVDLNGRFFGGRSVNASFFSEERFLANDLAPNSEELAQINQST